MNNDVAMLSSEWHKPRRTDARKDNYRGNDYHRVLAPE